MGLNWSTTVPPMKNTCNCSEIRFSQWLESLRKDVECTFGIWKDGGCWKVEFESTTPRLPTTCGLPVVLCTTCYWILTVWALAGRTVRLLIRSCKVDSSRMTKFQMQFNDCFLPSRRWSEHTIKVAVGIIQQVQCHSAAKRTTDSLLRLFKVKESSQKVKELRWMS